MPAVPVYFVVLNQENELANFNFSRVYVCNYNLPSEQTFLFPHSTRKLLSYTRFQNKQPPAESGKQIQVAPFKLRLSGRLVDSLVTIQKQVTWSPFQSARQEPINVKGVHSSGRSLPPQHRPDKAGLIRVANGGPSSLETWPLPLQKGSCALGLYDEEEFKFRRVMTKAKEEERKCAFCCHSSNK